jgi:hypothetical protein
MPRWDVQNQAIDLAFLDALEVLRDQPMMLCGPVFLERILGEPDEVAPSYLPSKELSSRLIF